MNRPRQPRRPVRAPGLHAAGHMPPRGDMPSAGPFPETRNAPCQREVSPFTAARTGPPRQRVAERRPRVAGAFRPRSQPNFVPRRGATFDTAALGGPGLPKASDVAPRRGCFSNEPIPGVENPRLPSKGRSATRKPRSDTPSRLLINPAQTPTPDPNPPPNLTPNLTPTPNLTLTHNLTPTPTPTPPSLHRSGSWSPYVSGFWKTSLPMNRSRQPLRPVRAPGLHAVGRVPPRGDLASGVHGRLTCPDF